MNIAFIFLLEMQRFTLVLLWSSIKKVTSKIDWHHFVFGVMKLVYSITDLKSLKLAPRLQSGLLKNMRYFSLL